MSTMLVSSVTIDCSGRYSSVADSFFLQAEAEGHCSPDVGITVNAIKLLHLN